MSVTVTVTGNGAVSYNEPESLRVDRTTEAAQATKAAIPTGKEAETYDVEMEGNSGHTCHVYIIADSPQDAELVATFQFPELDLTHNTRLT